MRIRFANGNLGSAVNCRLSSRCGEKRAFAPECPFYYLSLSPSPGPDGVKFLSKSNSVHYYELTMELLEKSVVWKHLYKIIYHGVQENFVVLKLIIFFVFRQRYLVTSNFVV